MCVIIQYTLYTCYNPTSTLLLSILLQSPANLIFWDSQIILSCQSFPEDAWCEKYKCRSSRPKFTNRDGSPAAAPHRLPADLSTLHTVPSIASAQDMGRMYKSGHISNARVMDGMVELALAVGFDLKYPTSTLATSTSMVGMSHSQKPEA